MLETVTESLNMSAILVSVLVVFPMLYVVFGIISKVRQRQRIEVELKDIPGPPTHWFYGNLHEHPGPNEKGLTWLNRLVNEHPRFLRLRYGPFKVVLLVYHPDTIKAVTRSSLPKPIRSGGNYALLTKWLGEGLLAANGEKWFRNRRLLTPAFHFDVLKPYMEVYNKAADILIEKWIDVSKAGDSFDIYRSVSLCTLEIILTCAFSSKLNVQSERNSHPYVSAVLDMSTLFMNRIFNPIMHSDFIYYLTPGGRKFKERLKIVHKMSSDVIRDRKQILVAHPEAGNKRYRDFLDILLTARDENGKGLTDKEIQDEVDTFLFEGHDTTASAISWILYTLAGHPDAQERCRQEVMALFSGSDNTMDWDKLNRLPYTTLCIKEAMRLHSPVNAVAREVNTALEIDGVTIPVGTNITIHIHMANHNPAVWGEDHMEFRPERFENEETKNMDPFAYIPFSAGSRNCIGQNFAMHEIKVVVAKVLTRFSLRLDQSNPARYSMELVMRSATGFNIFLDPII